MSIFDFEAHFRHGEAAWVCNICDVTYVFDAKELEEHYNICKEDRICILMAQIENDAKDIYLESHDWMSFMKDIVDDDTLTRYKLLKDGIIPESELSWVIVK